MCPHTGPDFTRSDMQVAVKKKEKKEKPLGVRLRGGGKRKNPELSPIRTPVSWAWLEPQVTRPAVVVSAYVSMRQHTSVYSHLFDGLGRSSSR
jgi:hypothetical protein